MEEEHVPRIIRMQREWAKRRELGPPPTWEDVQQGQPIYGVAVGAWPGWKRTLFRLTKASCFLPARLT